MKVTSSGLVVAIAIGLTLSTAPVNAHAASGVVTAPGKPTNLAGTPALGKVTLTWAAPVHNGGHAITSYHVQYSDNGGTTWHDSPAVASPLAVVKNLTNGVGYVFHVAANNGTATGAYSDTSDIVIPHGLLHSTSFVLSADKTIRYGDTTSLETTLMDTTAATPIDGVAVELLARPAHATSYTTVDTQPTDRRGVAHFDLAPTESTAYKFYYAGNWLHHLAQSFQAEILVSQIVKASITKSPVERRHLTKVWGTVKPGGKTVELQRLIHGTFTTLPITTRVKEQRLPNGKTRVGYILEYFPKKKGRQTLRVIADDDSLNSGGWSKPFVLKVT
jgi:hypothetical protein